MPLSSGGMGLIGSGMGMLGSLLGMGIQQRQDKMQWQHDLDMYNMQKKDQLDFWNMQNLYNSPAQQMQRLKDAGLNPNLVYGSGTAYNTADQIDQPSAQSTNVSGNQGENVKQMMQQMANALPQIYDLRLKQAETNKTVQEQENLVSIKKLTENESRLKLLLGNKQELENSLTKDTYDAMVKKALLENQDLSAGIGLKTAETGTQLAQKGYITAQTKNAVDENTRAWQNQRLSLQQAIQNIIKTKAETTNINSLTRLNQSHATNLDTDTQLKQVQTVSAKIEAALNSMGYSIHDSGVNYAMKSFFQAIGYKNVDLMDEADKLLDQLNKKHDKKPPVNAAGSMGSGGNYYSH